MLKSNYKTTNNVIINSLIELGDDLTADTKGKGRKFVSKFIEPGVAHYDEFGDVLITKETLDKFINTMVGAPVIIRHKDITDKNADKERVGVISNVWFNEMDGWYYCDGIIWDKQAIDLVKNQGWNVSCTYDFESDKQKKTHNGKQIDMEFTGGEFLHLALVPNPRYERASIVMNSKAEEQTDNVEWITVKGNHIPVRKGQSKTEAIEEFLKTRKEKDNNKSEDNKERISKILYSELPEAEKELSELKTKIRKNKESGNGSQEERRQQNIKQNKLEEKIESLKKELEDLRQKKAEYIEKEQPKYSTTEEHRKKIEKAVVDIDWKEWLKKRAKSQNSLTSIFAEAIAEVVTNCLGEIYNSFPDHEGRPGKVGGSLPKENKIEINPNYKTELKQVIEKAKKNPNERQKLTIGKVTKDLEEKAKEKGFDISGYNHNLDVSGTRHAFKEHGSAKTEEPRGQIPIDDSDFEKIPEVIYKYDDIEFTGKNKTGLETITYKKIMSDNTIYYVEEIRTGQKTLTINTLYKHKNTGNPRTSAKNSNPLSNASIYIIPHLNNF